MLGLILIGVILILLVVAIFLENDNNKEFGVEHVKCKSYNPDTSVLSFFGGRTNKFYVFIGSCTIWRTIEGERVCISLESYLADIWSYWKYKENKEKYEQGKMS